MGKTVPLLRTDYLALVYFDRNIVPDVPRFCNREYGLQPTPCEPLKKSCKIRRYPYGRKNLTAISLDSLHYSIGRQAAHILSQLKELQKFSALVAYHADQM